ncbi:uncharacterized protein TNCV_2089031 [Trichonephila clavipes]|nr:uncharacterized protein TNCV_2089031 [Trichonephila clavipes]
MTFVIVSHGQMTKMTPELASSADPSSRIYLSNGISTSPNRYSDADCGTVGPLFESRVRRIDVLGGLSQNPKLNIVECIEGLDNIKKYLVFQRSDDNFKISADSVTALDRDLGIDPEFPSSKLKKKIHLFVYEGSDEPASNSFQQFTISSANGRFNLLSECYSIFYFLYKFRNISDEDLMKA